MDINGEYHPPFLFTISSGYLFYYEVLILHLYNEYDYNSIPNFIFYFNQLYPQHYLQIQLNSFCASISII